MILIAFLLLLPLVRKGSAEPSYSLNVRNGILKRVIVDVYDDPLDNLDLSSGRFKSIRRKAFINLMNLQTLNLENNLLTTLPKFVFSNQGRLEHLSLARNNIHKIVKNVFFGLDNLKTLNVSFNPFLKFGIGSLFGLPKNVNIYVRGCMVDFFDPMIFEDSNYPTKSDIKPGVILRSIDKIYCMKEGKFLRIEVMKNDEKLEFHCENYNQMRLFALSSPSLLRLSMIGIESFEEGWYQLHELDIKVIDLSNNQIEDITKSMLKDLPNSIEKIILSYNKIKKLSAGVIQTSHVNTLELIENEMKDIEEETFKNTYITRLNLNSNLLSNLKFVKSLPSNMSDLSIQSNNIHYIPNKIFFHLSNLKNLDLSGNNISKLEKEAFRGLKSLETLELRKINIFSLESDAFRELDSLKTLDLSDNGLTQIPLNSFTSLKELKKLILAGNRFSTFQKEIFKDLTRLEYFDLRLNKLTKITPDLFSELPKTLKSLILNENEIVSVENGSFVDIPQSLLDLSSNRISNIQSETFHLPNLESLNLKDNYLTDIKFEYFKDLPKLSTLILSGNSIQNIKEGSFRNSSLLNFLDISDNELQCLKNGVLFGLPKSASVQIYSENIEIIQTGVFEDYDSSQIL